jgi:hypothetical protein
MNKEMILSYIYFTLQYVLTLKIIACKFTVNFLSNNQIDNIFQIPIK